MTRAIAIAVTCLLALASASPALAGGSPTGTGSVSAGCVWKWKKKKVIKKIKRNGKIKRIVRIKKYRACMPVKPPAPARIGVNAFEFYFILSTRTIGSGDTIAELNNRGEDPHDLHVSRLDGGDEVAVPETAPSTHERVRFITEPGTYRLWCSLPFHAERGMDATFEATGTSR